MQRAQSMRMVAAKLTESESSNDQAMIGVGV
jgi:hypothetical protein